MESRIDIILANGDKAGNTLKELSKTANSLNKSLRDLDPSTKAFADKAADLQKVNAKMGDIRTQIKGTTQASDVLKSSFGGILNQIPGFSSLSGALSQARGGVGGLTSGFGLLRGAIIATGIGALVILVIAVVSWFAKTEKGANMISGAFKAMGAVIDTLMNRLMNIGDTLKQLFSNPLQFFKNLGKDIVKAAEDGYDLVQVFDALEDKKRDLDVADSETEKNVTRLLTQSKNVARSYEERLALIEQADKVERVSFNNRTKYLEDYLKTVEREVAAAEKTGTMGDDLADKLAQAQIALNNRATEQASFEEKLANRREVISEKQDKDYAKSLAERKKLGEQLSKEEEERLKQEIEARQNIEDLKLAIMQDGLNKEIATIALETERKIEALIGSAALIAEQKVLLETEEQILIAEVRDKFGREQAEKDAKKKADQATTDKAATDKQIAEETRFTDVKIQMEKEAFDAAMDATDGIIDLLGRDEAARKKNAEVIKALKLGSVTASLAAEISAIWEYANKNPGNALFPGFGNVIGVIKTIAATSRAATAISKINSAKFAEGGMLRGRRHYAGGIPGVINSSGEPIEMEDGEIILNRRVGLHPAGRKIASDLNVRFGGRKFETGGPVTNFSTARSPMKSAAASQATGQQNNAEIKSIIANLVEAQDRRIDRIKVINVVSETAEGIKTINSIKADADV